MSKENKTQEILDLYQSSLMPTYSPSVVVASGKGVTVRDVDGMTYYDFTSGIGVNNVGYSHQKVVRAIQEGVLKVHLVDGRMAHSLLLEIFTREGVGTEITQ